MASKHKGRAERKRHKKLRIWLKKIQGIQIRGVNHTQTPQVVKDVEAVKKSTPEELRVARIKSYSIYQLNLSEFLLDRLNEQGVEMLGDIVKHTKEEFKKKYKVQERSIQSINGELKIFHIIWK